MHILFPTFFFLQLYVKILYCYVYHYQTKRDNNEMKISIKHKSRGVWQHMLLQRCYVYGIQTTCPSSPFRPAGSFSFTKEKQTLLDVQHARWIQQSAQTSPAAPRPSCHLWPGDRPRWPPHIHHQWWQSLQCPSIAFPTLWMHHWKKKKMTDELSHLQHAPCTKCSPVCLQSATTWKCCHTCIMLGIWCNSTNAQFCIKSSY